MLPANNFKLSGRGKRKGTFNTNICINFGNLHEMIITTMYMLYLYTFNTQGLVVALAFICV